MSSSIRSRHTGRNTFISSPITGAAAVTPNDATDLLETTLSLYIGTAGTLKVTMVG